MSATLRTRLDAAFAQALIAAGAPEGSAAAVNPASRPEFGDYQANGVMGAAKRLKRNPREMAQQVVDAVRLDDLPVTLEIAGPGFINITLAESALQAELHRLADDVLSPRTATDDAPVVVIDYSSPNLAKEMHVGHLRSTIIGDAVSRVLEHTGHRVIRQNHVGDWGTQFGMLLAHLRDLDNDGVEESAAEALADLEGFYRAAKQRFDADAEFADRARRTVVDLQSGDPDCRAQWSRFIDLSLAHCDAIYQRLGTRLTRADVHPESAYNDDLALVVSDLSAAGLLETDDGAECVFLDEFTGKDGTRLPLIVQKSDGGYLYATTDLASVRYRANTLAADRVLYFVDTRQSLHFRQLFAVARAAGFADASVSFEHMPFGTMLGDDGKPFRTRSGDVVKLADLLDEAYERALALVREKNSDLADDVAASIAEQVGIGAVKYADLSKNRASDYVFSWASMLSFDGDTAPYLQYAHSRIRSVFRKAEADGIARDSDVAPATAEPAERSLAVLLARFPEVLDLVAARGEPHHLCGHLYAIAVAFMAFYEQCPILSAQPAVRDARLALAELAGRTLATGLDLLGISAPERM